MTARELYATYTYFDLLKLVRNHECAGSDCYICSEIETALNWQSAKINQVIDAERGN